MTLYIDQDLKSEESLCCLSCGAEYSNSLMLRYHECVEVKIEGDEADAFSFPCLKCPKVYKSRTCWYRHMKYECGVEPRFCYNLFYPFQTMRITQKTHECDVCGRMYKHNKNLVRHRDYECGLEPRFKCTLCDFTSYRKYSLQRHLTRHGKHRSKLDWNYQEFMDNHSALGLKSDIIFSADSRNSLDQQGVYRCHRCSRTYKYQQTLVRHLKYECGKAPQFSYTTTNWYSSPSTTLCTKCNQFFLNSYEKNHHICKVTQLSEKLEDIVFSCPKCGKTYKSRSCVYRHMKYECGKLPAFKCDLGFSIDYNYGFDVTNQQDGHPYRCHLCGKCYMHKGNMRRHMRFECGKPPHLKCDHCRNMEYMLPNFRNEYYPNRQEECPFKCGICGKFYKYKSNMQRHMRFECGKQPQLKCDRCPYRTYYKHHLNSHSINFYSDYLYLRNLQIGGPKLTLYRPPTHCYINVPSVLEIISIIRVGIDIENTNAEKKNCLSVLNVLYFAVHFCLDILMLLCGSMVRALALQPHGFRFD
ncbi:zinc finger protein 287-like [Ctenocephalides felis]|uniref:zinc finger protein 287-like n=1 Tax=Ctenocephalides felis TaxID=7515 RepID=UPI000E6E3418|nr:zinc finger protein 287-like [Ctenocephalides felis]